MSDPRIPPRLRPGWEQIPHAPGEPQPRLSDGWLCVEMDPADGSFWGLRPPPMSRAVFAARMVQFAGGVSDQVSGLLWADDPAGRIEREDARWHITRARLHLDQIEAGLGAGPADQEGRQP